MLARKLRSFGLLLPGIACILGCVSGGQVDSREVGVRQAMIGFESAWFAEESWEVSVGADASITCIGARLRCRRALSSAFISELGQVLESVCSSAVSGWRLHGLSEDAELLRLVVLCDERPVEFAWEAPPNRQCAQPIMGAAQVWQRLLAEATTRATCAGSPCEFCQTSPAASPSGGSWWAFDAAPVP